MFLSPGYITVWAVIGCVTLVLLAAIFTSAYRDTHGGAAPEDESEDQR